MDAVEEFYKQCMRQWLRTLRRRSHKPQKLTWEVFRTLDEAMPIYFEVVKSGSFSWKLFSTLLDLYVLGRVCRRIAGDFHHKYGHSMVLLETFVERGRFLGTCYWAANWIYVRDTQGRSRNNRRNNLSVPVKQIYLYPLEKRFRESLKIKSQLKALDFLNCLARLPMAEAQPG